MRGIKGERNRAYFNSRRRGRGGRGERGCQICHKEGGQKEKKVAAGEKLMKKKSEMGTTGINPRLQMTKISFRPVW